MSRLARLCLCILTAAMLSSCAPLTMLDAVTPHDTYRSVPDLAYGGDWRQALDLYLPLAPLPGHPVVLFFYGGSWQSGRRADYRFVGEALAARACGRLRRQPAAVVSGGPFRRGLQRGDAGARSALAGRGG